MSNLPLVSVLMTAFNREKYIAEAIESVLNSTYTNFELIIVDDCSTDSTVEIAKRYHDIDNRVILYQNQRNLGDYPNRNRAAALAKGKYIKYLDADDIIYTYGLEVMVNSMLANPEAALGMSRNIIDDIESYPYLRNPVESYRSHYLKSGLLDVGPSGAIIKRSVFEEIGRFSGKRYIGDTELWLRIAARHPVVLMPPSLVWWRQHEGQEYFKGSQDSTYDRYRIEMNYDILNSIHCPLPDAEKKIVFNELAKRYYKSILKSILKLELKNFKILTSGLNVKNLKLH